MTDLADRLTKALDRAEQALTGCGTDWDADGGGDWLTFGNAPGAVPVSGYVYDETLDGAAIAAHMVAWQPARVLALIARDRALLATHAHVVPVPECAQRMVDELRDGWCSRCLPDDTPGATLYAPWPCDPVRLLAAFWLPTTTEGTDP